MARDLVVLVALAMATSSCPRSSAPLPPAPSEWNVSAQPASGDFSWSIGETRHSLRGGAVFIGPGGALELVLADVDAETDANAKLVPNANSNAMANSDIDPCALHADLADGTRGPERVYLRVPRGLDVDYPLQRAISPELLQLQPLERKKPNGGGRSVARYELELETIDWKPGGRVVGRLAWVGVAPGSAPGIELATFGEGRFDVPLCASRPVIDALAMLPGPRDLKPIGAITGTTLTGPLTVQRGFADLRPWFGLPPHVTRLELYPDPFLTCATRASAKGTAMLVDVDSGTGLGKHNGTRQPLSTVECRAGATTWDCFGDAPKVRGFIEVRESDLRVGGHLRGVIAIEGEKTASVSGEFDVELCGGD